MLTVREFNTLKEVNFFLQGGLIGGADLRPFVNKGGLFLHGLTVIFTSPVSETVTFNAGGAQVPMSIPTVLAQITAQTTGVVPGLLDGKLTLIEATPTSGVAITAAGTANALLGLGAGTGIVYAAPGDAAPDFLALVPGLSTYLVVTEDS